MGVHVAMSADRVGALHTSIQALVTRTIVLRLNDENQYGMLGLRKHGLTPQSPAGRGVEVATRLEMQFGVLGGAARIDEQATAIEQLASHDAGRTRVACRTHPAHAGARGRFGHAARRGRAARAGYRRGVASSRADSTSSVPS